MGKLELWERITLNAIFGGILVGEECRTAQDKAIWLHEIINDQKMTFRSNEVVHEIPETRSENVLEGLRALIGKGLVTQAGKNKLRVSASGAAAIAAEEKCVDEFEAIFNEGIGLPLAA